MVASPAIQTGASLLQAVQAVSATDVWAVGYIVKGQNDSIGGNTQTLIEHWNGQTWQIVPSPNPSSTSSNLDALAVITANDIWAVGSEGTEPNSDDTVPAPAVIEHWDGSMWKAFDSPAAGGGHFLASISAVSANDIWAVGRIATDLTSSLPLIEHWNGTSWQTATLPKLPSNESFTSVKALSANDAWATGVASISHWDGHIWQIVASPGTGNGGTLTALAAISSDNIWAVGSSPNIENVNGVEPLIEHWDGHTWSIIPSPSSNVNMEILFGVYAVTSDNIWAVGNNTATPTEAQTFIDHWDGSTWKDVYSFPAGTELVSISGISSDDMWAVGLTANANGDIHILIEHHP